MKTSYDHDAYRAATRGSGSRKGNYNRLTIHNTSDNTRLTRMHVTIGK
jgi:hypothetical protein